MQNTANTKSKRSISSIYLTSHGIIVLFFVPVFITCFVFADSIVTVLFPDSWLPIIPYFRALSLIACVSIPIFASILLLLTVRISIETAWIHLALSVAVYVVVTLVFYLFGKGYIIKSFRNLISSHKE